jgi:cytochrome P450
VGEPGVDGRRVPAGNLNDRGGIVLDDVDLTDIDLTDLDRFSNGFPHEMFTRLRRDAPVFWHDATASTPGGEGFWSLTTHAHVLLAASDAATFSSEGGGTRAGGGTLIEDLPRELAAGVLLNFMDDPRHQRIRKLVTPALSPRVLAAMESELRVRARAIVDDVADRGACDFVIDVAAELPLQAIARLLGVPQDDRHQLFEWATANLDYDDRELGQSSEKTRAASDSLQVYGTRLLEEKRRAPGDDMLSAIVHGHLGDGAGPTETTELEQLMFFNLLIAAGSETTRNSIAVGVAALSERPDDWSALQRDRSLLPNAVEEILRWASSTPYNRRTATRDVEVGGRQLRAGDKVVLWWASANRDEAIFADPFRFDIRRHPNPHVTFGHGTHFCLGANLARIEITVVLDELLDRFAAITPTAPIEWTRSNKHTGVRHMPVELTSRS